MGLTINNAIGLGAGVGGTFLMILLCFIIKVGNRKPRRREQLSQRPVALGPVTGASSAMPYDRMLEFQQKSLELERLYTAAPRGGWSKGSLEHGKIEQLCTRIAELIAEGPIDESATPWVAPPPTRRPRPTLVSGSESPPARPVPAEQNIPVPVQSTTLYDRMREVQEILATMDTLTSTNLEDGSNTSEVAATIQELRRRMDALMVPEGSEQAVLPRSPLIQFTAPDGHRQIDEQPPPYVAQ